MYVHRDYINQSSPSFSPSVNYLWLDLIHLMKNVPHCCCSDQDSHGKDNVADNPAFCVRNSCRPVKSSNSLPISISRQTFRALLKQDTQINGDKLFRQGQNSGYRENEDIHSTRREDGSCNWGNIQLSSAAMVCKIEW